VQRKHALAERFAGMGWLVPAILDALTVATDLYMDAIATVHVDRYWAGHVGLLGDAAWGGTLGGQGTSLAIVGTHVLAHELAAAPDVVSAWSRYEARMRRYATRCQSGAVRAGGFFAPKTRIGLGLRNVFYGVLSPFRLQMRASRPRHDAAVVSVVARRLQTCRVLRRGELGLVAKQPDSPRACSSLRPPLRTARNHAATAQATSVQKAARAPLADLAALARSPHFRLFLCFSCCSLPPNPSSKSVLPRRALARLLQIHRPADAPSTAPPCPRESCRPPATRRGLPSAPPASAPCSGHARQRRSPKTHDASSGCGGAALLGAVLDAAARSADGRDALSASNRVHCSIDINAGYLLDRESRPALGRLRRSSWARPAS